MVGRLFWTKPKRGVAFGIGKEVAKMLDCKQFSDVPISDAEREESVRIGILRAKEHSALRGFTPGDLVIYENIPILMTLKAVEGDKAVLWVDRDESTIRRVFYSELIDPDILDLEVMAALSDVVLGLDRPRQ